MAKKEDFQKGTNAVLEEIMSDLKTGVSKGNYTIFDHVIRADTRCKYADLFRKNFDFAAKELKSGRILSLDLELIGSTCWVGPSEDSIDNPAAAVNPLLEGTEVAAGSAKSDYAEKLANAIKDSKITYVELPADFLANGVRVWKTTQEERDIIMAALPPTVTKFSNRWFGDFTNKDLQNLTDLMNRIPGIEVHVEVSTYGNPKVGPFDDETYLGFVNAAKSSDGIYIDYSGFEKNPLFKQDGIFLERRLLLLEQATGAIRQKIGMSGYECFDKNYLLKQQKHKETLAKLQAR